MKCSGETGLGIESFQDIHVGVDGDEVLKDDEGYDDIDEEELLEQLLLRGYNLDNQEDVKLEVTLSSQVVISGMFRAVECLFCHESYSILYF